MKSVIRFAIFCGILVTASAYFYERGPVSKSGLPKPCPGLYCGRTDLNESHYSGCGKCPRGWRVSNNTHSICQECDESPSMYDWFYLAFHAILVLVLHFFFIDMYAPRRSFTKDVIVCHLSAVVEVTVSSVLSVLALEPLGQFDLMSCRVQRLADFYTFFHNPNPNYIEYINCTQEAVYPLYTLVFVFYGCCAVMTLILRPYLSSKFLPGRGRSSIYAALYFLPILAVMHSVGSGLIYIAYPYIVLILSIISSATHFAYKLDQKMKSLVFGCFKETRNFVILVGHWLLHAFGILAITQMKDPGFSLPFLSLAPLPALFYCLSARFSDPNNFSSDLSA